MDEPRRYLPQEIAAAMAITAASRRLSGIGAAIMQCPRHDGGTATMTDTRQYMRARIDAVTVAIEQRGAPPPATSAPSMAIDGGEIRSLLVRATRQLVVAREAACSLAAEPSAAAGPPRSF